MKHVDDVVEAIFRRLCHRYQHRGKGSDTSMGLIELRLALGVTEAQLNEALVVLRFSETEKIRHLPKNRVEMGPEWLERCRGKT